MKNTKRALRRHHKFRKRNNTLHLINNTFNESDKDWVNHQVLRRSENYTICSCSGCCNPRRSEWTRNKLTLSEQKQIMRQFDEYEDDRY